MAAAGTCCTGLGLVLFGELLPKAQSVVGLELPMLYISLSTTRHAFTGHELGLLCVADSVET